MFETSRTRDYGFSYKIPESFFTDDIVDMLIKKERIEIAKAMDVIRSCQKELAHGRETGYNALKVYFHRYEIEELEKKIRYWEFKRVSKKTNRKKIDIDRIKEDIRCEDLLGEPERALGNRWWYKLRDENTASCCVYVDQNSFHDYGSGDGGSVIDLYMILNDCDFKTAIKELNNML